MKNISNFAAFFVLLICLLPCQPLAAQSTEWREVSFRVMCYAHAGELTSGLVDGPSSGTVEVPFFTSGFSDPRRGRFQNNRAVIFIEETRGDGSAVKKIIATGPLAASPSQTMILIPAGENSKEPYRILAFDDRESSFPMGATRVLNLGRFPARLNLAGAYLKPIAPAGFSIFPIVRKVDEWNMFSAKIEFQVADSQWIEVSTQSWKASELKRDLVILDYDAASRQPIIRLYQDIPPSRRPSLPTQPD